MIQRILISNHTMKVSHAVYLFVFITVILSCVEAQFKNDFIDLHSLHSRSTNDCDDILLDLQVCTKPLEEKISATNFSDPQDFARLLSFFYSVQCGDCNNEYIRYAECVGDVQFLEQSPSFRTQNNNGEYCIVLYYDEVASGRLGPDPCEDCDGYSCEYVETLTGFWGCCVASNPFDMAIPTNCSVEPCSNRSELYW